MYFDQIWSKWIWSKEYDLFFPLFQPLPDFPHLLSWPTSQYLFVVLSFNKIYKTEVKTNKSSNNNKTHCTENETKPNHETSWSIPADQWPFPEVSLRNLETAYQRKLIASPFAKRWQLQMASWLEMGLDVHFLFSTLGFCLAWMCVVPGSTVTVSVSSCVNQAFVSRSVHHSVLIRKAS